MDKLPAEYLPLLMDDPIYVLEEHGDHAVVEPEAEVEEPEAVYFTGENKKGIAVFLGADGNDEQATEDEAMLFKGLNALEITLEDIALIKQAYNNDAILPEHKVRLVFSQEQREDFYQVTNQNGVTVLTCQPLAVIRESQDLKVKYWLALKELLTNK